MRKTLTLTVALVQLIGSEALAAGWWVPPPAYASNRYRWDYVLASALTFSSTEAARNIKIYDIDAFENSANTIAALHAAGRYAVCYFSAGSWENFRPDAALFPPEVLGNGNGWSGEKWLDIRQIAKLQPIMKARMQMAKSKACDAVEPDLVDGFTNDTGFPLTATNQINYNKMIADTAHSLGLGVALKNDVEQASQLAPYFDFVVNEQCFEYKECNGYAPFLNASKAILNVEYRGSLSSFCPQAKTANMSSIKKKLSLTQSYAEFCP
jgi:hypothetical protein